MVYGCERSSLHHDSLPLRSMVTRSWKPDIDVSNGVIHIIDGVLFAEVGNRHHRPCCGRALEHSSCPALVLELGGALVDLESSHWSLLNAFAELPASTAFPHTVQWERHFDKDPSLPRLPQQLSLLNCLMALLSTLFREALSLWL
jgi:hypothetical protein